MRILWNPSFLFLYLLGGGFVVASLIHTAHQLATWPGLN